MLTNNKDLKSILKDATDAFLDDGIDLNGKVLLTAVKEALTAAHLREIELKLIYSGMEILRRDRDYWMTKWDGREKMNFTDVEMDWVVRGLFALQKQQPPEAAAIQRLINRLANTVYQVEPLTDEFIKECGK